MIPTIIMQTFDAKIVIPIGIPTNETNTEMETEPVAAEVKQGIFEIIQIPTRPFLFFTYQFIMFYVFQEIFISSIFLL